MSAELPKGKLRGVDATFELVDIFAFPYLLELIEQAAKEHGVDLTVRELNLEVNLEWNEGAGDFERFEKALAARQVFFGYEVKR